VFLVFSKTIQTIPKKVKKEIREKRNSFLLTINGKLVFISFFKFSKPAFL
jgi:hypothetical protein